MRLLLPLVAVLAYVAGRFVERARWMADEDSYKRALIRRLLDSDVEIQMEV